MNIRCLRHPQYDGETSPILSCTGCCKIFVARIKERGGVPDGPFETYALSRIRAAQKGEGGK